MTNNNNFTGLPNSFQNSLKITTIYRLISVHKLNYELYLMLPRFPTYNSGLPMARFTARIFILIPYRLSKHGYNIYYPFLLFRSTF